MSGSGCCLWRRFGLRKVNPSIGLKEDEISTMSSSSNDAVVVVIGETPHMIAK